MKHAMLTILLSLLVPVIMQCAAQDDQVDGFDMVHQSTMFSSADKNSFVSSARNSKRLIFFQYLSDGMDPNVQHSEEGITALHRLSMNNKAADIRKHLLALSNININIKDCNGHTPLHYAILFNCHRAAKDLLRAGADIEITNNENETALQVVDQFYYDGSSLLIKTDADKARFRTMLEA